ncbi:MAG: 2-oxoglutarate and iron-dependent oxygenase domain-containing protein [Oleibacter sp.]|nr:2-oxoglutarate and iron-dependent oxygenase domain-containing protein [Thalassolituus sp.]
MSANKPTTHTAFTELPVVDIALLFSNDLCERKIAAASLDKAVRAAGFFYLKGHGVMPSLIDNLKQAIKTYFAQDVDQKMKNYIGLSNNHTGYVPQGEEQFYSHTVNQTNADLKEAYDIGPNTPSLMARFTDKAVVQLPDNDIFKKAVQDYYQAMLALSETLFKGFALALNLEENTFTKHLTEPPSQLRLIHYFDNPNAKENDSGIGAHTDYEFFTILLPTAPGLQVLNGANEWINVPIIDGCFVINIGDMMELVTNGQYVATSHRVRQVKEERYAFPFFSSLDYDTEVAPLAEFIKDDEPSTYEPLICGDHLLAQTMQTFGYLKKRLENGEIHLPEKSKSLLSFGQASIKQG